jgi:cytidylate kinase
VTVLLDGQDVTGEIRSAEVTDNAHYAARNPLVRQVLVELQRIMGRQFGSFVAEGRDQGSVVFPDADFKFYMDASSEVRARRRQQEQGGDLDEIRAAIEQRDAQDKARKVGPLVRPEGALVIDTSALTLEEVVARILAAVNPPPGGAAAP